ncbi:prolyl oligopeptidase family serine peptidase [Caulobacter sp. CCNWLY153]|uniref:S9 family peptidase n=1 Tax=unclassified Caulobacter TaxID=2648921 RepID=UPI002FF0FE5D
MRRLAALAVGCLLIAPSAASAEPYTVDRYLRQEQLGGVSLDPTKRWLVVQRYRGWETATRFDLEYSTRLSLGRVQVFDLAGGGTERALELPAGYGYTAFGVSPGGRHLALGRVSGHAYELGVVDLDSGRARWFGVTPRMAVWGPSVAWASDDRLLVSARPAEWADPIFGFGFQIQERLTRQWAASARGEYAATVVGSGRYRNLRPKAPVAGLVSINVVSGEQKTLVVGEVSDLEVSPDGRAAAAIVAGEDFQPGDEPTNPATEMVRKRLAMVDLDTGRTTLPCPACDVMTRFIGWSSDGRGVLIYARQSEGSFASGRYWRFDRRGVGGPLDLSGLAPVLAETWDKSGMPLGGWLDGAPVVYARRPGSDRGDYWRITPAGPKNLTAALPAEGRAVGVSPKAWAVASAGQVWRVTRASARPWGVAAADLRPPVSTTEGFRAATVVPALKDLALSGAAPALPWPGPHAASPPAGRQPIALAGATTVDLAKDGHGVQTVGLSAADGARRVLVTVNPDFESVDFAAPIAIQHKGADGRALTSWLYLPPKPQGGGPPPVVVLPYPGTSPTTPPANQSAGGYALSTNAQILAGAGYAALVPALPFIPGKEPMDGLADQILAPVDAAARLGLVDGDRIAAWGHSYGAYAVVAAATQTTRFKAVVAGAPTVNLMHAYGRLGPYNTTLPEAGLPYGASTGWLENGQARMGAPPWKDPTLYLRNSPATVVDRITAPMLILQGDLDKSIDQPQALFAALYRLRKDAVFVTYRGEGHIIYGPGNVRDQYARILSLLDETIGPRAPRPSP